MIFGVVCLLIASSISPEALESRATQELRTRFERAGRSIPIVDPGLSRAARSLAQKGLSTSAANVADLFTLTEAVSAASASDPSPKAWVLRASPPEQLLVSLRGRNDLEEEPVTHVGIGAAVKESQGALVILSTERRGFMLPYPRVLPHPQEGPRLCGELGPELHQPKLFITRPDGTVDEMPVQDEGGGKFCAQPHWKSVGRHTVEALGQSQAGPQVTAVFFLDVGLMGRTPRGSERSIPEARGKSDIVDRINALRSAHHASRLTSDARLNQIAQQYAERMAREHFFAHVSADGQDLRARLRQAGYAYHAAGENLGTATDVASAHFGIEHSPGHRQNLLNPAFNRVGLGVAPRQAPEGVVLVEIYAAP